MATQRFQQQHIDAWRQDGVALIPNFFTAAEVASVAADFERVFPRPEAGLEPLEKKSRGEIGRFHGSQFATFQAIPFDCSEALNLIGVHPALMEFAKTALNTDSVHLYQCQAWAKFTGVADYDQPFHCDFVNHTLTVPGNDAVHNSVTILCYFSDVTEAHGAMHYVSRRNSNKVGGPEATLNTDPAAQQSLQQQLLTYEESSAAPAGSIVPYGIDIYHRGTNMTLPGAHRYAVMACYKRAGNDAIGYHAWPYHHLEPWHRVFDHATPEQLSCFGVPLPGDPFWNETTIQRAQARYPDWNMSAYLRAVKEAASSGHG